jgi:hypothetical protein
MAHGRGTTQLIHDPAARSQKPCVRAVCFHPHIHPSRERDSCGRFQRAGNRNLVRSTKGPPRRVRTAPRVRAGTSPRSGAAARHATRNVRACTRIVPRFTNPRRGGARRVSRYRARSGSGGYRPREDNVSGLNIQFDIVLFRTDIDCPARGGARARRPTSDVPATEACAPHCRGLLVRPLVGGPATMTPDMMRGATRRSVKKKVDLEVKHASRLSE